MTPRTTAIPQAFAALAGMPALQAVVQASLDIQAERVRQLLSSVLERPLLLQYIEQVIAATEEGVIALEGPPGSGVSTLLCSLAVRHPYPLWLIDNDDQGGAPALYGQIVATRRPGLPLIDPAAQSNPLALERLLAEVGQPGNDPPLVLLIDSATEHTAVYPFGPPLPPDIPPRVVVVYGCTPGQALPYPVAARIELPNRIEGNEWFRSWFQHIGCAESDPVYQRLFAAAQNNPYYAQVAWAMLRAGVLANEQLPATLEGLYTHWWRALDALGRQIALALAAAGAALPFSLCAALCDADPAPLLDSWAGLGLIAINGQKVALAHESLRTFIAGTAPRELAQQHAIFALLALEKQAESSNLQTAQAIYLERYIARHAALAPQEQRNNLLATLVQRSRVQNLARQGRDLLAAQESAWELWAATNDGSLLRMIRAALTAGNLAMHARSLSVDTVIAALPAAVADVGREQGLKRVVQLVEQLPDGRGKAAILRQLGEACYALGMRSSAMRLLSRALDLEEKPTSRSWREQRDQLLATLATHSLELDDLEGGLEIATRIEHLERRAQIETLAVRRLLAKKELTRAQKVARAILHESMGAWARAEVGVALCREHDSRGRLLLAEIAVETVSAWAQIELACDEAMHNEDAARQRIAALPTEGQRDRGLARLAHSFALADKDGDALAAAEQIVDVEVRVAALLDLRLTLEGLVAMLALERATSDISGLTGDARTPLLSSLAAAHAALGRRRRALSIVEQLAEGEERDRGLSKVAMAFARQGDFEQARKIVQSLQDDDERDWTLDELARLAQQAGEWAAALSMAHTIRAADQRARTLVELAVGHARQGQAQEALVVAMEIELANERARAITLIGPLLVRTGEQELALSIAERRDVLISFEARSRYRAMLAAALAEAGWFVKAETLVSVSIRPLDQARALIALAQALLPHANTLTYAKLGAAMRIAALGRDEAMRVLELATPLLASLDDPALLREAAKVVDEVDKAYER
jgi:hypothetical protein